MVEMVFALVFIVLPLMFGIVDFSRALYAYHFTAYAAREATRWASVRGAACSAPITPCPVAQADVANYVMGGNGLNGFVPAGMNWHSASKCTGLATVGCLAVTATWLGTDPANLGAGDCTSGGTVPTNSPGCIVQVKVTYRFGFSMPLLGTETNNSITMSSTSQMVISQ
jgi:Flp pilus assembly protein TadG